MTYSQEEQVVAEIEEPPSPIPGPVEPPPLSADAKPKPDGVRGPIEPKPGS